MNIKIQLTYNYKLQLYYNFEEKLNECLNQRGARKINNVSKKMTKIVQIITEEVLNRSRAWIMNKDTK